MRFALADGASESMLSGLWADLLVRTWCKARRRPLAQILEAAGAAWEVELAAYLEERERSERPVQWFEEPGLDRGAHATLLGLSFTTGGDQGHGTWHAVSVGDTCLFQVRDDELLSAFPIKSSSEFDSAPKLVPSRPADVGRVLAHVDEERGDWRQGDIFYLVTDAVGAWFLRSHEEGTPPWRVLDRFARPETFPVWVDARRRERTLRNDDATVMRVEAV
ncbi:MAG: hypothetical protein M3394_08775 [Actinomycetota bacterium]|nr:hypothetical protein [Actinomycetota bacterium]